MPQQIISSEHSCIAVAACFILIRIDHVLDAFQVAVADRAEIHLFLFLPDRAQSFRIFAGHGGDFRNLAGWPPL